MKYLVGIMVTFLVIIIAGNDNVIKCVKPEIAAVITWTLALLMYYISWLT